MSLVIVKAAHGIAISFKKSITGYAKGDPTKAWSHHRHGISGKRWVPTDVECRCAYGASKGRPAASASPGLYHLGGIPHITAWVSSECYYWWILAPPLLTFFSHLWTHSSSYSLTQPVSPSHIQTASAELELFQHQPLHTVPRTGKTISPGLGTWHWIWPVLLKLFDFCDDVLSGTWLTWGRINCPSNLIFTSLTFKQIRVWVHFFFPLSPRVPCLSLNYS